MTEHLNTAAPSNTEFKIAEYRNYNNILLIEDNPADARLVQILLEEADFGECRYTNKISLGEAIDELSTNHDYDVVLLDLTLPDSRGFDTLSILINSFPNINVIVMTGLSDKVLGLKAVKARFDERGLKYDLRQQAGAGTWQLFSHDPNGAKVELDFDPSESL